MDPDLMRTTGLEIHRNQRCLATEPLHHIPMRDGRLARRRDAEPKIGDLGPSDRRVYGRPILLEPTLYQGMIGLHHFMLGELTAHLHIGKFGFAHQHEP